MDPRDVINKDTTVKKILMLGQGHPTKKKKKKTNDMKATTGKGLYTNYEME